MLLPSFKNIESFNSQQVSYFCIVRYTLLQRARILFTKLRVNRNGL